MESNRFLLLKLRFQIIILSESKRCREVILGDKTVGRSVLSPEMEKSWKRRFSPAVGETPGGSAHARLGNLASPVLAAREPGWRTGFSRA